MTAHLGDPIATLLVGAEGAAEIDGEPWARPATDEEKSAFIHFSCGEKEDIYQRSLTDSTSRPYFLVTILESAPEEVQVKARSYCRCLRLTE